MQYQQLPIFLGPNINPKIILTSLLEFPKVSHENSGEAVLCFYGPVFYGNTFLTWCFIWIIFVSIIVIMFYSIMIKLFFFIWLFMFLLVSFCFVFFTLCH